MSKKISFPPTLKLTVAAAAGALVLLTVGAAQAQTRASVELEGPGTQVHPAIYEWEGEIEPVMDPGANFYTFFYTGTVYPDGTVPFDTEIQRVPVSNLEWEQNRDAMVASIQAHIEGGQDAGESSGGERKSIVNRDVKLDGNFEYVDTSKDEKEEEIDPSQISDPEIQAEWTFYYDQLVLWQYYCKRVILNDQSEDTAPNTSAEKREREEYIDAINAYEGDLRGIDRRDLYAELATDLPEARDFTAASYFNAKRDYKDQSQITALRDEFVRLAQQREDKARRLFDEMIEAIEARREDQQNYDDWIQEKSDNLNNFVTAWSEVKDGRLLNFGQTYYLLTEEPVEAVPSDARSVPVRKTLTPQDLIEEDGSLKPAQYRPGY